MFRLERLGRTPKARFYYKQHEYENIQHTICENENDNITGNGNIDYLTGYQDAMKVARLRLNAIMTMTGITEQCTKDYILKAIEDTDTTVNMVHRWTDKALESMSQHEETKGKKTTPCDYSDNDGHYHCPYDAQGGDDCRNYCGLGVDE